MYHEILHEAHLGLRAVVAINTENAHLEQYVVCYVGLFSYQIDTQQHILPWLFRFVKQ